MHVLSQRLHSVKKMWQMIAAKPEQTVVPVMMLGSLYTCKVRAQKNRCVLISVTEEH